MDSSPIVLFTWWSKEKPPWSLCCSDGVGGHDENVSGVLERPRVYFSRQTAQVILIPYRATLIHPLPLWAPTVLKYCPFKMRCPCDCVVHQSDLDEVPQFQDERLPLQKKSKNVLNLTVSAVCKHTGIQKVGRPPERRGACMGVVWQTQTRCFSYVLPGVWLSGRTKQIL